MSDMFSLSAEATKFNKQILVCSIVIWFAVVACAISSLWGQPFSKKQRSFWTLILLAFPLVGLLAYIPFSIKKENYPGLFNVKKRK